MIITKEQLKELNKKRKIELKQTLFGKEYWENLEVEKC